MDAAAAAQPVPWPDAPTQVTDLETAANVLSMQERAVRSILRDINDGGDEAQEKYAGDDSSQSFRRWERALLQTADGMQLTDIKFWALHAQAANWTEEDWNRLYSRNDRQFIYRVLMSTLTRTAMEAAERADQNGMLVYRFFHMEGEAAPSHPAMQFHPRKPLAQSAFGDPTGALRAWEP